MKMFIIIYSFIIFNKYIIASDVSSSNESKYIDLLPEEEKEEFLKSIAKRVFQETHAKNNDHKISGEISDDQLNEHSQFVQKILQEETANLRKNGQVNNKQEIDDKQSSNEMLKVKSLEKEKMSIEYESNGDRKDVDLTFYQNISRKKRDRIPNINEAIPERVKVKGLERHFYDNSGDVNNKSNESNSSPIDNKHNVIIKLNKKFEESDAEDIQVKNIRRKTETRANNENSFESNAASTDISIDTATKMISFDETLEVNSKEKSSNLKSIEDTAQLTEPREIIAAKTEVLTEPTKGKNDIESTQVIYESEVTESSENQTSDNIPSIETTAKFEEATTTVDSNTANILSADTKEVNETRRIKESTINVEIGNYSGVTGTVSNNLLRNIKEGTVTKDYIKNYDTATTKDNVDTQTVKRNIINTTIKPVYLTTDLKYEETTIGVTNKNLSENYILKTAHNKSQKQNNSSSIIENSLKDNRTKDNHEFVNNIVKVLRQGLITEKKRTLTKEHLDEDNFKGLQTEYDKNIKKYSVYEIHPNQLPFKLKRNSKRFPIKQKNEDQSYYVPIYNYAPNKAYYNADNRLGPNVDDPNSEKEISIGEESKHQFKNSGDNAVKAELNDENRIQNDKRKFSFRIKSKYSNKINKTPIYKSKPLILVHTKPQYKDFYSNPADYLDVDYYQGRMNSDVPNTIRTINTSKNKQSDVIPNSDEDTHPFLNNLKDHMRAARHILYKNQRFGFIPPVNISSQNYRELEKAVDTLDRKVYKQYDEMRTRQKDLDNKLKLTNPDYYFGASKIDHENNNYIKKVGFINHLGNTKDLYLSVKDFPRGIVRDIKAIQFKPPHEDSNEAMPAISISDQSRSSDEKTETVGNYPLKRNKFQKAGFDEIIDNKKKYNLPMKYKPVHTIGDIKIIELENTRNYKDSDLIETSRQVKYSEENIHNNLRNRSKIYSRDDIDNETYGDFDTIKKILSVTPELDLIPNLDKLIKMNISIARTNNILNEIKIYKDVLADLLKGDSKALKQYDWLSTTVDIQAALTKLLDLTKSFQNGENIHPSDFQLLKYSTYLLKTADQLMINDELKEGTESIARIVKLPRSKKRRKKYLDKFTLNGWFLKTDSIQENVISEAEVNVDNFRDFLNDLQESLYDLHDAIKHIAMVTKYKKQNWLENLKQIYIKYDNKELLSIILHLSTSRLFDLIEESAQNGLEDDYEEYAKNNEKEVTRTLEELTFVLKLLHVMKK